MRKPYEVIEKGDYTKPGVTRTEDGVNFTTAVKGDEPVSLVLYRKGSDEIIDEIPMQEKAMGDLYSLKLKKFSTRYLEYNYRIGDKICVDPYARRIEGKKQFAEWNPKEEHKVRGGFDFEKYDWEGDRPLKIPYEDGIMYHIHVRGFTKSPSSKVKKKGTFQGVAEKIDYLKDLGINQLLLMPAYDFDEHIGTDENRVYRTGKQEPKVNYWGYGSGHYFAPKPSFASGNPVKEMKDMVKALHRAGIEVLMEIFFTEKTGMGQMLDCLKHWVSEYHIDGFCLMGNQAVYETAAKEPMFATTKLLAPYFPLDSVYPGRELPEYRNLAEYNDGFLVDGRRFLKGDEDQIASFSARVRKNSLKCGVINYITNHDGYTLADLVTYEERHNEENGEGNQDGPAYNFSWNCGEEGPSRKKKVQDLRIRQMKNAILLMMLSQGTPMLMAGDEFGNTQKGNNNPYCQDNEISWLDWNGLKRRESLHDFVKELIAFRKGQPLLHQAGELKGQERRAMGYPDISFHSSQAWYGNFENNSRHFGVLYCGEEEYLYTAYNLHWKEQEFAVPRLPEGMAWFKVLDTENGVLTPGEKMELIDNKSFTAAPRSILVLIGRK